MALDKSRLLCPGILTRIESGGKQESQPSEGAESFEGHLEDGVRNLRKVVKEREQFLQ
jgi:hypothetical protein